MKVLFIARHDLYSNAGGDTVQAKNTAKYLQKKGVDVDIFLSNAIIDYKKYDLIHFFNIIDPEDIIGHLQKTDKPCVCSTIYVNYREYDRLHRKGLVGLLSRYLPYHTVEYLKTLVKFMIKGEQVSSYTYFLKGNKGSIRYILKRLEHILPNSQSEYQRLHESFGELPPATIVPNGIEEELFIPQKQVNRRGVLCVARLEGRKNQLNLVRAFKKLDHHLTLIGMDSPNQREFSMQCRKEAGENVSFIGQMNQQHLIAYYNQAKVHILPSWFETTGLSNLEAAAMGCNIVVADKGDVKEYFGDLAYYCDPANPISIAEAIEQAYAAPVNPELEKKVRREYTWNRAAEKTLEAYKKVLNHD